MAEPTATTPTLTPTVLILGHRGSGKRTLQAALLLDLVGGTQPRWVLRAAEEQREVGYYRTKLHHCRETLPASAPHRGFQLHGRWRRREVRLRLTCVPPEHLLEAEERSAHRLQLAATVGVLFVVSPERYMEPDMVPRRMPSDALLLQHLIQELRLIRAALQLDVPLVLLYTKTDLYPPARLETLQTAPPALLGDLDRMRRAFFPVSTVRYCSALGSRPKGGLFAHFSPQGVREPFDWLLARVPPQAWQGEEES